MFTLHEQKNHQDIMELMENCKTHNYNPRPKGNYIKFTCPQCKRKNTFVYTNAGYYSRMFCSHKNSCGWSTTVAKQFGIARDKLKEIRDKEVEKAFDDHGLDLAVFQNIGFLTDDYQIRLCKKDNRLYTKKLEHKNGKLRWVITSGFSSDWAEFYPVISGHENPVLWVMEGDWDFFKALEDGLAVTSSVFGCKYLPKHTGIETFLPFEEIRIVYDLDMEGQMWASKLAVHLTEKFPDKKVCIVKLPFSESEKGGKDYCDWRKNHSVDELIDMEFKEVNIKKTKEELKKQKELEKLIKDKEESEKNKPEYGKIIATIPAEKKKSYVVCENGVYEAVFVEKYDANFWETKRICSDPIFMEAKLDDVFKTSSYVKLSCRKKVERPPMEHLWANKMHRLSKLGFNILSPNAKSMSEFFLASLENLKEEIKLSTRNGWIIDEDFDPDENPAKSFCLGSNLITENDVEKIERIAEIKMRKKGNLEDWLKNINVFLDTQTLIALGASTAGPLVSVLGISSFLLHLWGDSSTGKSIAQKIGASMWGSVGQVLKQWKGTPVGLECYFQEMNNVPVFLEDSQQQKDDNVKDVSYMFANNQSKPRGTIKDSSDVGLANSREWRTVLISSGEKRITDVSKQAGLAGRTIELYRIPKKGIKMNNFSRLDRLLTKNYGCAGVEIIKFILERREEIIEMYDTVFSNLENSIELDSDSKIQNRQIPYWALVLTGMWINQELFDWQFNMEDLQQEIKEKFGSNF